MSETHWLAPWNPRSIRIWGEGELEKEGSLDWQVKNNFTVNDIVYIYASSPIRRVIYETKVVDVDINNNIRVELIYKFNENDPVTYSSLKEKGLRNKLQGAIKLDDKYQNVLEHLLNVKKLAFDNTDLFVEARKSQRKFRADIIVKYHCKCCLCDINKAPFLNISHIKPQKDCTEEEKTLEDNVLLLCPNHDRLFDRGFVSFEDNGYIIISDYLSDEDCLNFGINKNLKIDVSEKMKQFMKYHREYVFKK